MNFPSRKRKRRIFKRFRRLRFGLGPHSLVWTSHPDYQMPKNYGRKKAQKSQNS